MFTKIIEALFYFLFFTVPFIFYSGTSEVFEINKMLATYVITVVITFTWLAKMITEGKVIFKRTPLDLPLLLFLLSQILSTYFSINQHMSIWGYYSRLNGGLLSLFCYALLYWAYVSNMNRNSTLFTIRYLLFSATLVAVWAILERLGHSPSCLILRGEFNVDCWVQKVQERPFATLGQANWLASWLVAIAPLSWALLFNSKEKTKNLIPALLILAAIYFTKSDAGYLGLGAAVGIFLLQFLPRGKSVKHLILYGTLLIVLVFASAFGYNKYLKDCFSINFERNIEEGTSSCQIRAIVWKGAVDIWRAYPLTGSGVETFSISYYKFRPVEHNQTSEWNNLYNKAHNEYLHYFATTGALGLGAYLLLIMFSIIQMLKMTNKNSNLSFSIYHLSFLSGYISLLITHGLGFSVVVTNTLLFLFPALAITLQSNKIQDTRYKFGNNPLKMFLLFLSLFACVATITTCYLLLGIFKLWQADYLYSQANKFLRRDWYLTSTQKSRDAIALRPDEALYYDKLAQATSYLAIEENQKDDKSSVQELIELTDQASKTSLLLSPNSLSLFKSRAIIFNRLSGIDEKYLIQGIEPLEKAIKIAPTEPEAHYNLAVIYSSLDQDQRAVELLEKTVLLKPDYYPGRVGLGEVYTKLGEKEKARQQYQWILDNLNSDDQEVKYAIEALNQ